ncbi:hypothetical protein GCM10010967_30040 [Dyadobacter beijingensis]|uniref:Uncharacterized protein n=1 Tax=Dyadobacter beijingensis TaxID=365489 RepID=A0ABQ2HXT1_9BACT|nr:hypothetical protein GCM10010967_30040 [Dyadobacter beijingensis]
MKTTGQIIRSGFISAPETISKSGKYPRKHPNQAVRLRPAKRPSPLPSRTHVTASTGDHNTAKASRDRKYAPQ